jgi:trehalose/maltose transport system substrate-binding protein
MLVRFLSGREEQVTRCRNTTDAPTLSQLYTEPELLTTNPQFPHVLEVFRQGVVSRPTTSAGKMYPDVSRAYWEAVHAVLIRKKTAAQAAAELQDELERLRAAPGVATSPGSQSQIPVAKVELRTGQLLGGQAGVRDAVRR